MGKISNTWDRNRLHTNRSIPRACPSSSNLSALTTELNEQTANRIGFGSNSHQAFHLDDAERRRRLLGDLRHGLQERPRSSRRRCCRPASQTPGLEREMGCEPTGRDDESGAKDRAREPLTICHGCSLIGARRRRRRRLRRRASGRMRGRFGRTARAGGRGRRRRRPGSLGFFGCGRAESCETN